MVDTAVLDQIKTQVAGINDFMRTTVSPLKEETDRIAQNLLALQKELRDARKADLMASAPYQRSLIQTGRYAGMQKLDLLVSSKLLRFQAKEIGDLGDEARFKMLQAWQENIRTAAALDSTTTALGDELVPTGEAAQLWMSVTLDAIVSQQIPNIDMPTEPFTIPLEFGDVNFYPGTQNVASKSTAPATASNSLASYELVGMVPWSYTLDEDSVVAMMPAMREHLSRQVAHIIDNIFLNGDTTLTNNINADGATIAATDAGKGHWLIGFDGLIHLPLIDNTAMRSNVSGAIADTTVNTLRKLMGAPGVRPSELLIVTDLYTWLASQTLTNLRTLDKIGDRATILTGQFGSFDGIPWLVSEDMLRADTDGLVTDAGNGTNTGRVLIFNKTQWFQGSRRQITMEVVRDPQKRQTILIVSFRKGLLARGTRSSATHTALAYNITGI